jgi:hypothetical protein
MVGLSISLSSCMPPPSNSSGSSQDPPVSEEPISNTDTQEVAPDPAQVEPVEPATSSAEEGSIVGVWSAPDGIKTINDVGQCTGMYYNNGQPLDIGGPMSCMQSDQQSDGSYLLVVTQAPNQASYRIVFSDDTMTLSSGGTDITLVRQ